ncbi:MULTISPECIES: aldehyde dehydrogenase family protein [Novipirellula]|uniref:NAD/NADP-dependent betaine aldehyde dehydrogenase n=1 Tax=Novipirellula caenicola TaxID=1536901 RepID=A0ABP9VVA9_9BACT
MSVSTSNRLPEVAEFLSRGDLPSFVGGKDFPAASGKVVATLDPGSGEHLANIHDLDASEIDRAVEIAGEAFPAWAALSYDDRSAILLRLADAVEEHKPIIAQIEALDAGKIEAQAQGDVQNFVDTLRYFVKLAGQVEPRTKLDVEGYDAWTYKQPWGACAFIFPWNFPFLLIGWGISPALAAGNTVIIKPAEDTSMSAIYLARLAKKVGVPDGVINVVTGRGATAGAALTANPNIKRMSFTGSPEVGQLVGETCGRNLVPVKLELGGKGAAVVFDDVDVAETAEKLVGAITFHSGQVCCDATRWLVHRNIYDEFAERCVELMKNVRVGHPLDPSSEMGPVVNPKQRERVLGYLEKGQAQGAKCLCGGGEATVDGNDGNYIEPSLLAGSMDNVAAREEIFGPVAYLGVFDSEEEAIELVNDTQYGLANSVWTKDMDRAARVAESMVAGNSWINAHNVFAQGVPYGGVNKSGLGGGVLSVETLMDYYRSTSVVRPL